MSDRCVFIFIYYSVLIIFCVLLLNKHDKYNNFISLCKPNILSRKKLKIKWDLRFVPRRQQRPF